MRTMINVGVEENFTRNFIIQRLKFFGNLLQKIYKKLKTFTPSMVYTLIVGESFVFRPRRRGIKYLVATVNDYISRPILQQRGSKS